MKFSFFEDSSYSKEDLFKAIPFLLKWESDLLRHINKIIEKKYKPGNILLHYDLTNLYFETKNNLPPDKKQSNELFVNMGLYTYENGLPASFLLTTNKKSNPINENLIDFKNKASIFISNRETMHTDSFESIRFYNNGYIIAQRAYSLDNDNLKEWLLDENDYIDILDNNNKLSIKVKEKIINRKFSTTFKKKEGYTKEQLKKFTKYNERLLCVFSPELQEKQRNFRAPIIIKAREFAGKTLKQVKESNYNTIKYLKKVPIKRFDSLGDETNISYRLAFNDELLDKEERLDGYFFIYTNLEGLDNNNTTTNRNFRFTNKGMLQLQRRLSYFDIYDFYCKHSIALSTFNTSSKPTSVHLSLLQILQSREDGIRAHFLVEYLSLLFNRILEKELNYKYKTTDLISSLNNLDGTLLPGTNTYHFTYYDSILEEIGKVYNVNFSKSFRRVSDIKKLLAAAKDYTINH